MHLASMQCKLLCETIKSSHLIRVKVENCRHREKEEEEYDDHRADDDDDDGHEYFTEQLYFG